MKKRAYWRSKRIDNNTFRYSLFEAGTHKELTEFGGFSCWNNSIAGRASLDLEIAIENKAKAAGYTIVENMWD